MPKFFTKIAVGPMVVQTPVTEKSGPKSPKMSALYFHPDKNNDRLFTRTKGGIIQPFSRSEINKMRDHGIIQLPPSDTVSPKLLKVFKQHELTHYMRKRRGQFKGHKQNLPGMLHTLKEEFIAYKRGFKHAPMSKAQKVKEIVKGTINSTRHSHPSLVRALMKVK